MTNLEIDILITKKVMGLEKEPREPFSPSVDISHAWKVVEKLQEHWNVNVGTANPYSKTEGKAREIEKYYCEIYGEKTYLEYEETVPLAICKAALKTVGIEIS